MSDFALGVVAAVLAAAPLSVLLLLFADVLPMPQDAARRRWIVRGLAVLSLPAVLLLGVAAWGWAGAAHLQPLCAAYARPEYRSGPPRAAPSLALDLGAGSSRATPPAWVSFLAAPRGPVASVEALEPGERGSAPLRLEVRRVTHHSNAWWRVEMDRFRLVESRSGVTLALADEIWIVAGRARYHCGVGSGPDPVARTSWPANDGVARFVARALIGQPGSRD